jgi:hypothetical protein
MHLVPSDNALLNAFTQYSQENSGSGLSAKDQILCLKLEFGLDIKSVLYLCLITAWSHLEYTTFRCSKLFEI